MQREEEEEEVTDDVVVVMSDDFVSDDEECDYVADKIGDAAKVEDKDCIFTPSDLISEVWNAKQTVLRNVRMLIASIAKYLVKHRKIDPEARRVYEGEKMKSIFSDIYRVWNRKEGLISEYCRREEVNCFMKINVPKRLYRVYFVEGLMSETTYREWCRYHTHIVQSMVSPPEPCPKKRKKITAATIASASPSTSFDDAQAAVDMANDGVVKRETKSDVGAGIGSVLKNLTDVPYGYSQHVHLRDNHGKVSSLKTPGENGPQLARLQIYDTKDVAGLDQRVWWKHAKLRSQFFVFNSDRKDELLGQLVGQVGIDLKKVPGVKMEVRKYADE